ncbi:MAG: LPS-assembly protein LptD [Candidatus Competibacteraceae bacterium]|nr:LPS-assembly protein LptD [Candidatus Competibacteraceae bacterium]
MPDDQEFGDDRAAVFASYFANPLNSFYADVLYQEVSDDEYLDDFDNTIDLLSTSTLERHLNLTYYGREWLTLIRTQDFQTIDDSVFDNPDDEPYSRLPQVLFMATGVVAPAAWITGCAANGSILTTTAP